MQSNNVFALSSVKVQPRAVDLSMLADIYANDIKSMAHFCLHFTLSDVDGLKALVSLVDGIFKCQVFNGAFVLPHSKYEHLHFLLSDNSTLDLVLCDLVDNGEKYLEACGKHDGQNDNLDMRVKQAKQLLELSGYIVLREHNI